jgi:FkbM family methyltransferase
MENQKINFIRSLLIDYLSVKTFDACMEYREKGNTEYLKEVYDLCIEEELKLGSDRLRRIISKNQASLHFPYRYGQYFPPEIISLSDNEVFIDGGGYIGDTIIRFAAITHNNFSKIHSFEPVKKIFDRMLINLAILKADSNKVITHNAGLYSSTKEALFQLIEKGASRIDKNGDTLVKLVKLDEFLSEKERSEITYIKLDIEGAEMEALEGMKETISKYKPKLAISIYHKADDFWKIPLFIHQLNPNYKLYIRQYAPVWETVCYAVEKELDK